jgi:hypothetical protein
MTPERQDELRRRIDLRFDQFSLDELRSAKSGAMTFGSVFPEISIREREFAEKHFNVKMDELRSESEVD